MSLNRRREITKFGIADFKIVRSIVKEHNVDAIVNCVAYANVDAARSNGMLAEKLTFIILENLAIDTIFHNRTISETY